MLAAAETPRAALFNGGFLSSESPRGSLRSQYLVILPSRQRLRNVALAPCTSLLCVVSCDLDVIDGRLRAMLWSLSVLKPRLSSFLGCFNWHPPASNGGVRTWRRLSRRSTTCWRSFATRWSSTLEGSKRIEQMSRSLAQASPWLCVSQVIIRRQYVTGCIAYTNCDFQRTLHHCRIQARQGIIP